MCAIQWIQCYLFIFIFIFTFKSRPVPFYKHSTVSTDALSYSRGFLSRPDQAFMHRGENLLCFILGRPQDADGCKYRSLMGAQDVRARALTLEPYATVLYSATEQTSISHVVFL